MFKIGYFVFAMAFSVSLCGILFWKDYFRKIICFAIFSNSAIVMFVTIAYKYGSIAPIGMMLNGNVTDPIPSVLMLTAIVVGISVQSIALALYLSSSKEDHS